MISKSQNKFTRKQKMGSSRLHCKVVDFNSNFRPFETISRFEEAQFINFILGHLFLKENFSKQYFQNLLRYGF